MRYILLLLCSFLTSITMSAEGVSKDEALQKARQFMPGKIFMEAQTVAKARGASDDAFYVFNVEHDGGFVIVSGDSRTVPILGYSEQGRLSGDDMPDNLKYWLECYAEQIRHLDNAKTIRSRETRSGGGRSAVRPLIKTQWDQGAPYNLMCPDGAGKDYNASGYDPTKRCLTGCVATAMAQLMYYHKYPSGQTATIPAYTTRTSQVAIDALAPTTFDWDSMTTQYDSEATGTSANEVARLMRYCGQAVQMDYGLDGSSASVSPYDMVTKFGYGKNARQVWRYLYSSSEWDDMIYRELSEGRPVLYGGTSPSVGHEFICDGYDGNGLYHFNWGWSGMSDGYFLLSVANPDDLGAGGGTSEDGYSIGQQAIIGLQPDNGEAEKPSVYAVMNNGDDWVTEYSRSSADADFTGISLPGVIVISYYYYADDESWPDYKLECGWGIYQDGVLKDVVGLSTLTLSKTSNWDLNAPSASFGSRLADGTYKLSQVYRPVGSEEWIPCDTWTVDYIIATVSGNTLNLRKAAEEEYTANISISSVDYSVTSFEVGKPVEVTVSLANNGDAFQELVYFWCGGQLATIVCGSVEPGKTGTVLLHFSPATSGETPVKITTDWEGSNVLWSETITVDGPKEQHLTATVVTPGLVEGVLTGTTLRVNANVRNEGSNIYENVIQLMLFENTEDPLSYSFGGPLIKNKSVMTTIHPAETKEVDFVIEGLNPDKRYFYFLYYSSLGAYESMFVGYPFSLTSQAPQLGDADGNGEVDADDISAIASHIMGHTPAGFNATLADINEDGDVNAADLVMLINMVKAK